MYMYMYLLSTCKNSVPQAGLGVDGRGETEQSMEKVPSLHMSIHTCNTMYNHVYISTSVVVAYSLERL